MGIKHYIRSLNLRERASHPLDELWDRRLGVGTFGHYDPTVKDGRYYGTAKYSVLTKVFDVLKPKANEVLFDIGCGLGRPMFFAASQYGFEHCVGIEANPRLVMMGNKNIESYRGAGNITIQQVLAQDANYDNADIIFMYNPFGYLTMQAVLKNLEASLRVRPRKLRIAYLNPIEERAFLESSIFEKTSELSHAQAPELNTGAYKPKDIPAVSFFESH